MIVKEGLKNGILYEKFHGCLMMIHGFPIWVVDGGKKNVRKGTGFSQP